MIPLEQAKLAEILHEEFPFMHEETCVRKAGDVMEALKKQGYEISRIPPPEEVLS